MAARLRGFDLSTACFRDVIIGFGVLDRVGAPVYWFGGRPLLAVLRAWGAGDGTAP